MSEPHHARCVSPCALLCPPRWHGFTTWPPASAASIEACKLEGHTARVCCVVISSNKLTTSTASYDGNVRIWDLVSGSCRKVRGLGE